MLKTLVALRYGLLALLACGAMVFYFHEKNKQYRHILSEEYHQQQQAIAQILDYARRLDLKRTNLDSQELQFFLQMGKKVTTSPAYNYDAVLSSTLDSALEHHGLATNRLMSNSQKLLTWYRESAACIKQPKKVLLPSKIVVSDMQRQTPELLQISFDVIRDVTHLSDITFTHHDTLIDKHTLLSFTGELGALKSLHYHPITNETRVFR